MVKRYQNKPDGGGDFFNPWPPSPIYETPGEGESTDSGEDSNE
jgi:hypothetical protein